MTRIALSLAADGAAVATSRPDWPAASPDDDGPKRTWDVRTADHQPVETVAELATALGWPTDERGLLEELEAFVNRPSYSAAPDTLRQEVQVRILGNAAESSSANTTDRS